MTRLKTLRKYLPEILLICIVMFYWFSTILLNPVAAGLLILLIIQLKFNSKTLGFVISGLFIFLSLWMILAFLSDFSKPPKNPDNTLNFIIYGTVFCAVLLGSSVFMLMKYSLQNKTN